MVTRLDDAIIEVKLDTEGAQRALKEGEDRARKARDRLEPPLIPAGERRPPPPSESAGGGVVGGALGGGRAGVGRGVAGGAVGAVAALGIMEAIKKLDEFGPTVAEALREDARRGGPTGRFAEVLDIPGQLGKTRIAMDFLRRRAALFTAFGDASGLARTQAFAGIEVGAQAGELFERSVQVRRFEVRLDQWQREMNDQATGRALRSAADGDMSAMAEVALNVARDVVDDVRNTGKQLGFGLLFNPLTDKIIDSFVNGGQN